MTRDMTQVCLKYDADMTHYWVGRRFRLHAPGEPVDGQMFTLTSQEARQHGIIALRFTRDDGYTHEDTPTGLQSSLDSGRLQEVSHDLN